MPYSRDTNTANQMDEDILSGPSTSFPYTHFEVNIDKIKTVACRAKQKVFSLAALHSPKAK